MISHPQDTGDAVRIPHGPPSRHSAMVIRLTNSAEEPPSLTPVGNEADRIGFPEESEKFFTLILPSRLPERP
jgi:hypothetical protein